MKRKLLTTAMKLARKKAHAKKYNQIYKSLSKYNIHVKGKKTDATYKFKQKPTTHAGIEVKSQKGTHYGVKGIMHKMHPKGAGAIIRRMPYVGSRETWGEEMHRMYGGVHMAQDRQATKKSVGLLLKGYNKRFKKKKIKKAEGGPVKLLKAKRGKLFKRVGRAALAGAALYGMSKFKMSPLTGAKIKTLPVKMENIGIPEITGYTENLLESPITLEGGGEVVLGKNVDKDLL